MKLKGLETSRVLQVLSLVLFALPLSLVAQEKEDSTNRLANLNQRLDQLMSDGKFSEALPLAREAVDITETVTGPFQPDTAAALNILGSVYLQTGDYIHAEPILQRCLSVADKVFPPAHSAVASALNNLAMLYLDKGEYSTAEPLMQRSLKIKESTLGPDSLETVNALNNLGSLYEEMGEYSKARSLLQRGLQTIDKIQAGEDPLAAKILVNLGSLYQDLGDFGRAEPLFQRSRQIAEKTLGLENPDTAAILQNLGSLYTQMGDYSRALPLLRQSLEVTEKALGPNHPATASALNSLAALDLQMKTPTQAGPLLLRALKIREEALGPDNPETGTALNNLGSFYASTGDYTKGKDLLERSLQQTQRVLGTNHPAVALTLNSLATALSCMGQYDQAEKSYLQSLKISESVARPNNAVRETALSSLALLEMERGQSNSALDFGTQSQRVVERLVGDFMMYSSERQRMAYQRIRNPYDILGSLGNAPVLAEAILRMKGAVLDSLEEDSFFALSSDSTIVETVEQLRISDSRLTALELQITQHLAESEWKLLHAKEEALQFKIESLQKTLAKNVERIRVTRRALGVTVDQVQSRLPTDAVLMEFIRYGQYLGNDRFEQRYGVVLIYPKEAKLREVDSPRVLWRVLGPAQSIEADLKAYAVVMRDGHKGQEALLRILYTQLLDAIVRQLPEGTRTLIISPDAELNFVNFGTLLTDENRFLAEKFTLEYVTSGRDLVFVNSSGNAERKLVAFANPAFSEKPADRAAKEGTNEQIAIPTADQRDYEGVRFVPLRGTEQEVQFLRTSAVKWGLQEQDYMGKAATEAQVKKLHSPYILHLATHGFFLPDVQLEDRSKTTAFRLSGERGQVELRNPMQRSGLALAGAQTTLDAWKRGEIPPTENDGILMAQEVGALNLHGTWLVVLSACDTGIGEARAGEGVLGLRRGFIQAGAQNLLMTLWPVSDKWTVEIMKAFYERAMKEGNAPQALAEVQREWLVRLKKEYGVLIAARIAGPFILTFQGGQ